MPVYDYRCNDCGQESPLFYKTFADYDHATPTCPHCGSTNMTRIFTRIAVQTGERDYRKLSSGEMLSVLEGGKPQEAETMYRQLGQDPATLGKQAGAIKAAKDAALGKKP
jgi:putative FmdB family regulatory protein